MKTRLSFFKRTQDIKEKSFKRFNEWSKKYDKSVLQRLVFRRSHDMFMENIVKDKRAFKILDIGCGTGEFALKLKEKRQDVYFAGVDISTEMISVAKKKFNSDGRVEFHVSDAEHIPYGDNTFDYITCSHSFHHYPNKRKVIREMFRVLKDDGKVMIIDGYKDSPRGVFIFDFIVRRHEVNVHHLHSKQS